MNQKKIKILNKEITIRNNQQKILDFFELINKNAKDCVGGKKVFIPRTEWIVFEKICKDLSE